MLDIFHPLPQFPTKPCVFTLWIWMFPKIGVPQNGWFKFKWMIWGYHYFRKHPYSAYQEPYFLVTSAMPRHCRHRWFHFKGFSLLWDRPFHKNFLLVFLPSQPGHLPRNPLSHSKFWAPREHLIISSLHIRLGFLWYFCQHLRPPKMELRLVSCGPLPKTSTEIYIKLGALPKEIKSC